jgi:prophage maintenance system killer protein
MHQRLLTLHPFADANGRTARLVLEWLLRLAGLPPAALRDAQIALFVYESDDANVPAGSAERQLMEGLDKGLALHYEWLQIDEQTGA